jgi:hypothetical protein
MSEFIDTHRDRFGVEPICRTLQVAPSSYYAHKARPPSARALRDEQLNVEIKRVYDDNFAVYGAEKTWRWTPWRWPSGPARTPAWTTWCITATGGCSPGSRGRRNTAWLLDQQ